MTTNALILKEVSKAFGDVRAVDVLSAQVPVGSIYGFLGPNGAGKTTTLRMIMNIICPDSGRIEVLGRTPVAQAKEKIGYMPEERGLYRKMSVRAVLSYLGAIKGMKRRDLAREISKWLETVGLTEWANRKVEELSKGMQQKLQFVATVLADPEILILDEPFSGLDPVNLDLLKGIVLKMHDAGKTVLFSTHIMEQAEKLCDHILLINKGRKVLNGTLDQIRSRYEANAVSAELEGDTSFISDLPMVKSLSLNGKRLEISLKEQGDSQELLRALVGRVRVRAFEVKVPSLHEIFVHLVGENNE
jgi:ABC-2 type transport system ATP-binding protein